jgi:8-oxo-dGTP pyrophosphatase MutT (NUDIX family)
MSLAENRLAAVPSAVQPQQMPVRRVRLSQLRKLRECEQVAAVCYRVRGASIEFLLIRTRGIGLWTFPKGSAEPGLTHAQAAALEAFEEAGVHGRIEEAAFAQYIRRKQGAERKSSRRPATKEFAVNAHLCEVSRLSDPKESNRNRTWFSPANAKLRLRDGREDNDGREFARVIDRAVARILRLRDATKLGEGRSLSERGRKYSPRPDTQERAMRQDALQTVQFEPSMQARGSTQEAEFMAYIRWQRREVQQSTVADAHHGKVVQGELLQFSRFRKKKAKVLAPGNH